MNTTNLLVANIQAEHARQAAEVKQEEVVKGSTVKYKSGYFSVSAKFKNTVNLVGIFSGRPAAKKVPITEVVEAYDEWSKRWQESEAYKCM